MILKFCVTILFPRRICGYLMIK